MSCQATGYGADEVGCKKNQENLTSIHRPLTGHIVRRCGGQTVEHILAVEEISPKQKNWKKEEPINSHDMNTAASIILAAGVGWYLFR